MARSSSRLDEAPRDKLGELDHVIGTVREGGSIFGKATPAHRGRTTHVWDVEVTDEANGKTIALFRCKQMVLRSGG